MWQPGWDSLGENVYIHRYSLSPFALCQKLLIVNWLHANIKQSFLKSTLSNNFCLDKLLSKNNKVNMSVEGGQKY